jgi:hypothetical protein
LLACSTSTREWAIGGHPGGHAENVSQPGGNLRWLKMSVASDELGKIDWNRLARTCRSHCRRARSRHSPPNEGADAVGGGGWRGMSRRNSCIGLPRPTSAMEGDPTRRKQILWAIERNLAEDVARPIRYPGPRAGDIDASCSRRPRAYGGCRPNS